MPEEPLDPTLPDTTLHAADEIGAYRLLEKIGEGGMGEVWRAEQIRPIRREVALKVIKAGLDSKRVVARFEMERQVLALMDHPAIAKVYEAGETPRGLPYFAMEYVAGDPVTDYCDRHRLDTQERLNLFAQICAGVQHAHEKGVIHRDLKPSNVLVTPQGDRPVPKIIDFGVAKATAQRLTERTLFTELGAMIGTPSYMSPEQADPTGLNVDTRTDVYALGVMLYELLTGVLPFDAKTLREAGYDEIRRRIREVDPPKPSTRAEKLGEDSAEIARRRGTVPSKLVSRLRGDLDWIVMKCLEKDRTRRYASPNELAADLRRHLSHEPVAAGPPGAMYRSRKFVRRHRVGVGIAFAAVIALAAFVVTTAAQNRRIAAERDRADKQAEVSRRTTEFMTSLFEVSDPSEARGNTITAREILDRGAETLEKELDDQPEVKGELLANLGHVYMNLGLIEKAMPMVERAMELGREVLGPEDHRVLYLAALLAKAYDLRGRYEEAEKLLRESMAIQERTLGPENRETLENLNYLAVVLGHQGRTDEAGVILGKILEIRRRTPDTDEFDLFWSEQNYASYLNFVGREEEALPLFQHAEDGFRRTLGDDDPSTLRCISIQASCLYRVGRLDEAERLWREAVDGQTRVLGPDHYATLDSMMSLAEFLRDGGRLTEAAEIQRKVVDARTRRPGPEDAQTVAAMAELARTLREARRPQEEVEIRRRMVEARAGTLGPEDALTLATMHVLAETLWRAGRLKEAEEAYRKVFDARSRILGPEDPLTTLSLGMLASVLAEEGRFAEAEPMFRSVLDVRRRDPGVEDAGTLQIMTNLATSWMTAGRLDEAESLLDETWEVAVRVHGEQAQVSGCCALTLAEVASHRGETEEALSWLRKAAEGDFGGFPAEEIEQEEDLKSLRDNAEFRRILATVREALASPTSRERPVTEDTGVLHSGNPGE